MTIKVALAGAGAFGTKHLDGIKNIAGVEVISLVVHRQPQAGQGQRGRRRLRPEVAHREQRGQRSVHAEALGAERAARAGGRGRLLERLAAG